MSVLRILRSCSLEAPLAARLPITFFQPCLFAAVNQVGIAQLRQLVAHSESFGYHAS